MAPLMDILNFISQMQHFIEKEDTILEKPPISDIIADFTLHFSLADVPLKVQEHAKLMMIDSLGVALASYQLQHAKAVRATVTGFKSRPDSTLWGTRIKASMADAVLANASLIHGMDYDDTHVAGIVHPSASVVSTAITVGEMSGASGREILEAVICGYEIIIRLALAARGGFHDRGFHCSGIVAPFAAACVAAKLLKLPKQVLVNALGICGSQAAALQEFLHDGSLVKKIHPGWGAHAGLYALTMAQGGLTGPREVFEGSYGLYASHVGFTDGISEAFAALGKTWRTEEISVKLYPCCHMIHSFSDCIFSLQKQYGFTADDIARIECRIEKRCYHIVCSPENAKKRPTTDYGMMFSLPYIAAISILKGKVSPAEIDESHMQNTDVLNLIDKVVCIEDETKKNPGHFPGWVQITLKDGTVYSQVQEYERGTVQNPISAEEITNKYTNNAIINLPQANVEQILQELLQLETLNNVTNLIKLLFIA